MSQNLELDAMSGVAEESTPAENAAMPDELAGLVENGENNPDTDGSKPKRKRSKKAKEPKEKKPPRDNIARIEAMTSISEVRKAKQVAVAKKAKASKNPDTVARYEKEIETADAKLKALLEAADTVDKLIEAGEDPNRIITAFIKAKEDEFGEFSEEHKVSKKLLKSISDEIPATFYTELPMTLHDQLNARFEKSDYRLKATCRNVNLMNAVVDGTIKYDNGKWFDQDGNQIGREAQASDTAGEGAEE